MSILDLSQLMPYPALLSFAARIMRVRVPCCCILNGSAPEADEEHGMQDPLQHCQGYICSTSWPCLSLCHQSQTTYCTSSYVILSNLVCDMRQACCRHGDTTYRTGLISALARLPH